jgi:DNA ligase-associated metallophosphoesterase
MKRISRPVADAEEAPTRPVVFGGLVLLPERAVLDREGDALFVADVHLGKAAAFRARGIPTPKGTTRDNLDRLSALICSTGAKRLVILGDFFHARDGVTRALVDRLREWREDFGRTHVILVAGNHDRHASAIAQALDIDLAAEPFAHGGVDGRHHPLPDAEAFAAGRATLAGHVHPVARLKGPGRDRLRLPCFFRQGRQLILPSFGAFTGGYEINGEAGSEAFAICGEAVIPLRIEARRARPRD